MHQRNGVPCINKTMQTQLLKNFRMFENILNDMTPIKIGEPLSESTKKKWLSREILNLSNEKPRPFNIGKEKADVDTTHTKE